MANLRIFGLVRSGLVLNGMVHGYCLYVVPCKIPSSCLEKQLCNSQFKYCWFVLVWVSLVWFGFDLNFMVHRYCLDVVPCKILSSWFEKRLSYGQYMEIWFGLVWLGLVWFGFEWYGTWEMSRCSYMQNFELLA